jgi:hypothetical protein
VRRLRPASGSGRLRGDPGADAIRVTWQTSFVGGPVAGALFVAVALEPAGFGAHLLDALYRRAAFPGHVDLAAGPKVGGWVDAVNSASSRLRPAPPVSAGGEKYNG